MPRSFTPAFLALSTLVASSRAYAAHDPNPLHLSGGDFLAVFVVLIAVAVGLMRLLARLVRTTGRPADIDGLSPVAIGYLVGGMPRAFDALFLALAPHGAAEHSLITWVKVKPGVRDLPGDLETFRRELPVSASREKMIARLKASAPASEMLVALRRRGLLLSEARRRLLGVVAALPAILVVGLGLVKTVVEWKRNQSVGILAAACAAAAVGLLVFWIFQARAQVTWATRTALRRLRRTLGAPRDGQLAMAVALAGATVLAGTAYAAYADAMNPPSSSSDDGDDDD